MKLFNYHSKRFNTLMPIYKKHRSLIMFGIPSLQILLNLGVRKIRFVALIECGSSIGFDVNVLSRAAFNCNVIT